MNLCVVDLKTIKADKPTARGRVYIHTEGAVRDEHLTQREAIRLYRLQVIPAVRKQHNIPEGAKLAWSQTAGCSCGCSPGFIIKNAPLFNGINIHAICKDSLTP